MEGKRIATPAWIKDKFTHKDEEGVDPNIGVTPQILSGHFGGSVLVKEGKEYEQEQDVKEEDLTDKYNNPIIPDSSAHLGYEHVFLTQSPVYIDYDDKKKKTRISFQNWIYCPEPNTYQGVFQADFKAFAYGVVNGSTQELGEIETVEYGGTVPGTENKQLYMLDDYTFRKEVDNDVTLLDKVGVYTIKFKDGDNQLKMPVISRGHKFTSASELKEGGYNNEGHDSNDDYVKRPVYHATFKVIKDGDNVRGIRLEFGKNEHGYRIAEAAAEFTHPQEASGFTHTTLFAVNGEMMKDGNVDIAFDMGGNEDVYKSTKCKVLCLSLRGSDPDSTDEYQRVASYRVLDHVAGIQSDQDGDYYVCPMHNAVYKWDSKEIDLSELETVSWSDVEKARKENDTSE